MSNRGLFYDEVSLYAAISMNYSHLWHITWFKLLLVIAYAHISNVETATTSVLSTIESKKLFGECGVFLGDAKAHGLHIYQRNV
jgi:hypothetical protein